MSYAQCYVAIPAGFIYLCSIYLQREVKELEEIPNWKGFHE